MALKKTPISDLSKVTLLCKIGTDSIKCGKNLDDMHLWTYLTNGIKWLAIWKRFSSQ